MKKRFFKILVRLNNLLLPSLYKADPMKLSKLQKVILGYRYWTLINSLN